MAEKCQKQFGWTAKKIVSGTGKIGEIVTFEYVVCPYCGSLDFEEYNGKPAPKSTKSHRAPTDNLTSLHNMEHAADQFDPADIMEHEGWKNRKQGEGNYTAGSLDWGWDFKSQFKPETLRALAENGGSITIDKYEVSLDGKLVKVRKARGG